MIELTLIVFRLPDSRFVLQRRTKDAPYAAGLLGEFGGHVEPGESVDECLRREIKEETGLKPHDLKIKAVSDFVIKDSDDFNQDRHFYLFEAPIDNLDFNIYEGEKAEAYTLDEIKKRSDLTASAKYTFYQIY